MDSNKKIRYAVVGLGSLAQEAVLPAFQHAENSELAAHGSGDGEKREELGRRYGCPVYSYEQFEECLASDKVDAAYIVLPNHLHRQYAERAARAGIHVLTEKPMAQNEEECRRMIEVTRSAGVKLMTAYRLHFEEANLEAIRVCQSGKLGDPRIFHSAFCQQVAPGNVRLDQPVEQGGGPLFDMGIYCINAARYLFRDEPVEVTAFRASNGDERFNKTEEMLSVLLRFPKDRLADFTVSFGASKVGRYSVIGTKGMLTADPAYSYAKDIKLRISTENETLELTFPSSDQFAPELIYFSDCILNDREPEPSGEEGLIDVQIIQAAYRACETGNSVPIGVTSRRTRPQPSQEIHRPPVQEPELVNAKMPSGATKKKT
jgi:glucose-fructose oxidoreductase